MRDARTKWRWLPHPGHFIAANRCQFRLATEVGGYIVSTVGEFDQKEDMTCVDIGAHRKYETMVFKSREDPENDCCSFEAIVMGEELDFRGYNDPGEAYRGHMELCEKWFMSKSEI